MLNHEMPDAGRLPERLVRFAEIAEQSSPLYGRLARGISTEPGPLEILGHAPHGQPAANILLAAVQFLLLGGVEHRLAAHYPSLGGDDPSDPTPAFVEFCDLHRDALIEIVSTRTVQTNEVRRCTALLPALSLVWSRRQRPLALVEIGPSAGLNLVLGRYGYDYGDGLTAGDPSAPLILHTRRRTTTPLPLDMPEIGWRVGIDLQPLDVTDPDDVRWGRALLWPDQPDRITRYDEAIAIAAVDPPRVLTGDAIESVAGVIAETPQDAAVVVFNSFVLNQFTEGERSRLGDAIARAGRDRTIDRVEIEQLSRSAAHPEMVLTSFDDPARVSRVIGSAHHHGEWLAWDG